MKKEVYWIGKIDKENFKKVIEEISELAKDEPEEINLLICSGGGSGSIASAFYDWVKLRKVPLVTIGFGRAESAAIIVLLAGKKRKCTPNTMFVVHGLRADRDLKQASTKEIKTWHRYLELAEQRLIGIMEEETKVSKRDISEIKKDGNLIWTAEEAKKKGFVHEIIDIKNK